MSSPPPATTTPGSNVTPMWGGSWPGRPPAVPPSCFSQLYGLNQCYDDIIMMKQILAKVICDMAANDPAFQKCLAEAIAASGSSVPILGVTNGSQAQPGQVGEWVAQTFQATFAAGSPTTVPVSTIVLAPGDWDLQATVQLAGTGGTVYGVQFELSPVPTGVSSNQMSSAVLNNAASQAAFDTLVLDAPIVQANVSVPTLLVYSLMAYSAQGGTYDLTVSARRAR